MAVAPSSTSAGAAVRRTAGAELTTVYVDVAVRVLPALSVAVTSKVFSPGVEVSTVSPSQDSIPEPPSSSAHAKSGVTVAPRAICAPSAGVVIVIVGFVSSTTVYVTEVVREFPASSVAVTVKVRDPSVAVSMALPSATVPVHDSSPEPPSSSAQAKSASTSAPRANRAPSAGVSRVIVGFVSSTAAGRQSTWLSL